MRRTVSVLILSGVIATTGVLGGVSVPGGRVQALAAPAAPACEDGWGDPALPFPGEYKAKVSGSWTTVLGSATTTAVASGSLTFTVTATAVDSVSGAFKLDMSARDAEPATWHTQTGVQNFRVLGSQKPLHRGVVADVVAADVVWDMFDPDPPFPNNPKHTTSRGGGLPPMPKGFIVDGATCTGMEGHIEPPLWNGPLLQTNFATWKAEPTAETLVNYTKAMEEVRRQAQGAQGLPRKQINMYLGALIDEIKRSSDPAKECRMKVVIEEAVKISQGAMNDILAEMQQQVAALRKGEVPLAAAMVKFKELIGEYVSFDKSRVLLGCPSQLEQLIAPILAMSKLAAKAHDMKDAVDLDRLAVLLGSDASAAISKAAKEMADTAFKEMKDNWANASPEERLRLANEARASEKASDIVSGTSDTKAIDWACAPSRFNC